MAVFRVVEAAIPAGGRSVPRSWPGSWEGEGSPGGLRQVMGEPDRGAAPVCLVRGLFLFFVFGDRFLTL